MINTGVDFLWTPLAISFLLIIVGLHFVFNPPKDMNLPTGLNIPISSNVKLNRDTWTEYHSYSGKIITIIASFTFLLTLLLNYLIPLNTLSKNQILGLDFALLMISVMAIFLPTTILTSNHMEKTFDKKGNRKKFLV